MAENRHDEILSAMYSMVMDGEENSTHRIQAARVFLSYEAPLTGESVETADNLFAALQNTVAVIDTQRAVAEFLLEFLDSEPVDDFIRTDDVSEALGIDADRSAQVAVGKTLALLGLVRERRWFSDLQAKQWVYTLPEDRETVRQEAIDFILNLGG